MAARYLIPPGCRRIEIGWETPDTEEPMRVIGYLTKSSPGQRWGDGACPAEPAEFCPLAVVEDKPHGVERPELLPLVEAALERLTDEAVEAADEADECAREDAHEARRFM